MATETVRFSQVVKQAGQPESYTLWAKPDQDKAFAALLRQNRVMTVHQETVGAKADYGLVGYTGDRRGSLLVFPKSLKTFEGKRIIGIKYDELRGAVTASAVRSRSPDATGSSRKKKIEPKQIKPAPASKRKEKVVAPPPNQIAFPRPEIVKREKPAPAKDPAEELARLKKAVSGALEALSKDKPVTAFNLLKSTLEAD